MVTTGSNGPAPHGSRAGRGELDSWRTPKSRLVITPPPPPNWGSWVSNPWPPRWKVNRDRPSLQARVSQGPGRRWSKKFLNFYVYYRDNPNVKPWIRHYEVYTIEANAYWYLFYSFMIMLVVYDWATFSMRDLKKSISLLIDRMASQPMNNARPPTVQIRGQPVAQNSSCCST